MKTIGIIKSPFKEKFCIPRQAHLLNIPMKIKLLPPYNRDEAILGLSQFKYIYVLFYFHEILEAEEKISVRPPRLGGNEKMGVFATRSPFRPNRIGLSIVKIKNVNKDEIEIIGGDFLDGTPVLDIKPYLFETDVKDDANLGWAKDAPDLKLTVEFLPDVLNILKEDEIKILKEIFSYDPRPTYKSESEDQKIYYAKILEYDLGFKIENDILTVLSAKIL